MSCNDIAEPIKSCVWLGSKPFTLPLELVTVPSLAACVMESLEFELFEDTFEIFAMKADSVLNFAVYRTRQNPNGIPDDGYALRFYFTLVGFDEEPQTAIMTHDRVRSNPLASFKVTENILSKINTTHHVFDLFVVSHMLEFKSLPTSDEKKKAVDKMLDSMKGSLSKQNRRDLAFILKSPGLKDTFTGRIPERFMNGIFIILDEMKPNFACIARYLRAREKGQNPNVDVDTVFKCIGQSYDDGPLPPEEATERYLIAHKLGLECYKYIASDYLLSILENDYDVLDILEACLVVHDVFLFEKAILSFLNRFHEITRSAKFQFFIREKAFVTRLIIHSARVWVTNNDVHIPSWVPTTEL